MVVEMCYKCKEKFHVPDPYAKDVKCPKCGEITILAEKICGECISSAQIADGNLICCMVSTAERLMLIYYNVDAGSDGGCPHFKRPQDINLEQSAADLEQMMMDVEKVNVPEPKKNEEKEFEDAFDKL